MASGGDPGDPVQESDVTLDALHRQRGQSARKGDPVQESDVTLDAAPFAPKTRWTGFAEEGR